MAKYLNEAINNLKMDDVLLSIITLFMIGVFSKDAYGKVFCELSAPPGFSVQQELVMLGQKLDRIQNECLMPDPSTEFRPDNELTEWCKQAKLSIKSDLEHYDKLTQNQSGDCDQTSDSPKVPIEVAHAADVGLNELTQNPMQIVPSKKCSKELVCNVARSLFYSSLRITSSIIESVRSESVKSTSSEFGLPACLNVSHQFSCLEELSHGIAVDVLGNIKFLLKELPEMTWEGVKQSTQIIIEGVSNSAGWVGDRIISGLSWAGVIEDKTSDSLIAASHQSDESVSNFLSDPVGFAMRFSEGFVEAVISGIRNNFGCENWEGTPYVSNCRVPMRRWECASCSQKMNAICGTLGYLGGELVSAYLTGGAVSVSMAISKSAKLGQVAVAVSNTIVKALPPVGTTADQIARIAKETGAGFVSSVTISSKALRSSFEILRHSRAGRAALKLSNSVENSFFGLKSLEGLQFVAKVASGSVHIASAPFSLLDKAVLLGVSHGDELVKFASSKGRVFVLVWKLRSGGSLEPVLKQGDLIQGATGSFSELVDQGKIQFEKNGVLYTVHATPDGSSIVVDGVRPANVVEK